ncbi:cytochrome c oxidase subunit II [Xanthobacteraceae bacterium Astr-EGSB]|uniref:cytochrome c oxidase subunit II n=1 Tax=Astrobacterium formosum TaxID=3069710 RepID=UPI0027B00981|nr:cytochrome c oxidase subunit II [Xanthobacteraceae bacterium Astr-EGSB]
MGTVLHDLLTGMQSALAPAGPNAAAIASLTWIMFVGGGLIFVFVMSFLAWALWSERRGWFAGRGIVIAGGIVFPLVTLSALLVFGLLLARDIVARPSDGALTIAVTGEQFWWRVRYVGNDGRDVDTANEIHVPVGEPVKLVLTTADVIHSLWIPTLAGKLDMIPGETNTLVFQADRPGVYRGQCTEYCGAAHALMAFDVVAHPADAFAAWLEGQARPAADPGIPFISRGRELFLAAGCGACHAVRGTPADGRLGPDLTHIGSRRTIAAGSFPNNKGTLAGWIASSQHLKPNNRMPDFNVFAGEELRAIAAYLESLK